MFLFRDMFMNVITWWDFYDEFFKNIIKNQELSETVVSFYKLFSTTQILRLEFSKEVYDRMDIEIKKTKSPEIRNLFRVFYYLYTKNKESDVSKLLSKLIETVDHVKKDGAAMKEILDDYLLLSRKLKFLLYNRKYSPLMVTTRLKSS
jgi:hypothetical protein